MKIPLQAKIYNPKPNSGFSLLEIIIASTIFVILSASIFLTYGNIIDSLSRSRSKALAVDLLNQEMENIRNLSYDEVGIIGGFPPGLIPAQITKDFQGHTFDIFATVRNIDDEFDGTVESTPQDTAPADYRLIELRAECTSCFNFTPVSITSFVAPKGLEVTTNNGSLFINVFDAIGKAVSSVDINVSNASTSPTINISDTTNASGSLQLVDIPTSTNSYAISVSKTGYSSAQTYAPGDPSNPNPLIPHATVSSQELTSISLTIDKLSSIDLSAHDPFCSPVAGLSLDQAGLKLIGSGPDVLKYSQTHVTDSAGAISIDNLEWDTYTFTYNSSSLVFAGSSPLVPLIINPDQAISLNLLYLPPNGNSLLVKAISSSSTLLSASVEVDDGSNVQSKETGQWLVLDSDWSDGSPTDYSSKDIEIENSVSGVLTLQEVAGNYPTSTNSSLISNTFDLGTSTSSLITLSLLPTAQPSQTSVGLQIASNNDNATWNFLGPDASSSTLYSPSDAVAISSAHDGDRYFRYKLFLNSEDPNETPSVEDIQIHFSSACLVDGHAYFDNLSTGDYDITVSASGYENATGTITVSSGANEAIFQLTEN